MNNSRWRELVLMNKKGFSTVGWALVILGGSIMIFSPKIIFAGLEWLLGIETIVGRDNVSY